MAGSKNVLIVEDEAMIRDLYRMALISAGYAVESAADSEEMYEKLKLFHPDFIFLDIMLPEVSGLEILSELRSNPAHLCIEAKIVILTNLAQKSVADTAIERGADGYIIKADVLPEDLPSIITSLSDKPEPKDN